ncbi:hypothetical protein C2G38_2237932 [Gigaspora rosea]|uniref:Uncharacterized protein n=1 Tax=Gigaspora rosea TaxID=44941 RepID=A0A397WA13_9GLOM|nr:hypothetical protein C2G38_2237932 [Gigaspora rosea]
MELEYERERHEKVIKELDQQKMEWEKTLRSSDNLDGKNPNQKFPKNVIVLALVVALAPALELVLALAPALELVLELESIIQNAFKFVKHLTFLAIFRPNWHL